MSDFREIVFSPLSVQGLATDTDNDDFPSPPPSAAVGNASEESEDSVHQGSSVFGASFNFINSIVGAGIIGWYFINASCLLC